MTSISSLGSALTQYQSPISSLDKNGDGIISADELAAANQSSSPSSAAPASSASGGSADPSSVIQRITADILSLMLQVQQQSDSGDGSGGDDGSSQKGILESLDTDGDGKLTTSEILAGDPTALGSEASSDGGGSMLTNVLSDMQKALQAYQNTYGSSPAADTADATNEIQSI